MSSCRGVLRTYVTGAGRRAEDPHRDRKRAE
jgi:hypothetical protein